MRMLSVPCVLRQPHFSDLGDAAGAHGTTTLTDREPQTLVHRDRLTQLHRDRHVVTRHHHLRTLRQLDRPRHIRRPEEELRPIVVEERLVTTTLTFVNTYT